MTNHILPTEMQGVYLTGHGGIEKLEFRTDIPVPTPGADEVLIRVGAAGINNTDINTRIGWYSKNITGETNAGGAEGFAEDVDDDGSWSGAALQFPLIQGADCAGTIVAVGSSIAASRVGKRVLVRSVQSQASDGDALRCITQGSERDGAFAQYMTAESHHALSINSDWSDIELACTPCAYSTAEGMLHRANVGAETVLITGASGGVGSAAVQLVKRRGGTVIALSSRSKADAVTQLGADRVIDRDADLVAELGVESVDVVVDLVAGDRWPALLDILRRGGRYVTSGAIAGPMVSLDVRTLYLKDLSFFGATYQPNVVFENLVSYIENNEIKPLVSKHYPLHEVADAQEAFLSKQHVGKLVLVPAE